MSMISSDSIDAVVSTHVLCSVPNAGAVLREITRVLKPGGRYYFFDHILSDKGTWMHTVQTTIEPVWSFIGDGCKFRNVPNDIDTHLKQSGKFASVDYELFEAPIALTLAKPHVRGVATKK